MKWSIGELVPRQRLQGFSLETATNANFFTLGRFVVLGQVPLVPVIVVPVENLKK
jgi:hypothetical protein